MKTINYVPCGEYFVAVDSKLVKVEITKVTIYPRIDACQYTAKQGDIVHELGNETEFYLTEEHFFKGLVVDKRPIGSSLICDHLNCEYNGEQFVAWANNEKIAEEIIFRVKCIIIKGDEFTFKCVDNDGDDVPNNLYRTRQELLDNNIVKVVDKDGVKKEVAGINIKLNLDEEQKSLIEEMKALAQRMNDAGLRLVYNETQEAMAVFNSKNLENYSYEDQGDCECDHELDYRHVTNVFYPDSVISEYYCICVGKKD